jgi:hypothetical protein
MNMVRQQRMTRGLRNVTEGLGAFDAEVFEAVANSPSPLLDTTMPALTRPPITPSCGLASQQPCLCRAAGRRGAAPAEGWSAWR